MEEQDFIYDDKERGTIIYVGSNGNDGQDHTFNPSHYNELKNSGKYQEAKDYLNDYNYKDPKYYAKVQRMKDQCDSWILYKQHQYELAGPENKETIDFINLYDSDYDNLNVSDNELAKTYSKCLSDLFGDSDEITLDFQKTKQKFVFDAWAKDNKNNNIHAYKKRLAETMGIKTISDSYLKQNGISVSYGDYDGSGTLTINKNSPILKNVISSFVTDSYTPVVSRITKDGKKVSDNTNTINSPIGKTMSDFRILGSYIDEMNDIVKNARNKRIETGFRDDYVAESVNYPFQFYGSDALDVRIDTGGQTGASASKTRAEYERELIGAMRTMLPGFHDIRVFTGPKDIIQNDEYGLAQPLDEEAQIKLFQLVTSDDVDYSDIIPSLNITSDGRCGFTFTVNGKIGSKNVPGRDRIQFTVYNWNTEKINQLMDANPEYRAIRKINEISRYNGTYESLDGNYYQYIGGGYGADAVYEDANGNRYNMSQMKDIRMRDDLINEQVNNILVRNNTRSGNYIGNSESDYYTELYDDEIIAASIYIGSQIIKQNPVDIKGRPLSVKEIANYLRRNYKGDNIFKYTENVNGVNSYSYSILMYLRDIRTMIDDEILHYYNQKHYNTYRR